MGQKADLKGKVCLVTGATRGIGKGIALQLAKAGAFVYITGRTLHGDNKNTTSLTSTAKEIEEQGGSCCAIQCDHSKDEDIKQVFEKIEKEQNGQLDVLVNNAYSAVKEVSANHGVPFWKQPLDMWDSVNNVGLRNHYICTIYASNLMVPRGNGLIVNISSAGGLTYLFNVAYGIGKAACDRMAADCGHELRKHGVSVVSLWPGAVKTEFIQEKLASSGDSKSSEFFKKMFAGESAESPEFAGIAISHLASDPNIMSKSGKILLTTDLASEYGFVDIDGNSPLCLRSLRYLVQNYWFVSFIPRWLKVPHWVMTLYGGKF